MNKYTVQQLLQYENIISVSFSYDNKNLLFSSDKDGVFNVYMVPIEGGTHKQLTFSKGSPVFSISFTESGNGFLYECDYSRNELTHIYYKNIDDVETFDLTPGQNVRAKFISWSLDKKSFFYLSNKRDSRFMDLYEMNMDSFKSSLIFKNEHGYNICSVSPDKSKVSLHRSSKGVSEVLFYSRHTKNIQTIWTSPNARIFPTIFNPNSNSLYIISNEGSEYYEIVKVDLLKGEKVKVATENGDVKFIGTSSNYKYFFYGINESSSLKLRLFNYFKNEELSLKNLPDGQVINVSISHDEEYISFVINNSTTPSSLYVYKCSNGNLSNIYNSLHSEVKSKDLVTPELVNYKATDGELIPAIFYEPKNIDGKAPAVIYAHGGPGGQSTVSYNPLIQYIVNNGIAVLDVNYRGSSGYGKKYYEAADLKHGSIDLQDCIDGKEYLISTDKVKKDSIGIIGESYGGYLVLAALAFHPNQFCFGVDLYGVSNWERSLKSIPKWWETKRNFLYNKLGNPYNQRQYIQSISPLFYAENITKPLMVVQGAKDQRVLKVESDEIVGKVRENGVFVDYLLFENEGHGLLIKENKITAYEKIVEFMRVFF